LWFTDYLSKHSKRKDYKDHFHKFERELKVPYSLQIDTDNHQSTLYHHAGKEYVPVKPNASGRLVLPELNLEIGLFGKTVRYWYQDELLLLPSELFHEIERIRGEIEKYRRIADEAKRNRLAVERKRKRLRGKLSREHTWGEGE
jgi:hypothetical protein